MNPLLSSQYYIPDVEARVDQDGTIYLYGSKDIVNDDDYCSNEYQVFYSKDMVHWEAGAISFSTEQMQNRYPAVCARLYQKRWKILSFVLSGRWSGGNCRK